MVREVDRRSVLKRVGAAGAVGAGLATGTASANEGNELIEMPPTEMAATVSDEAPELLENLYNNGVISEPTVDPLVFDQRSPGRLAAGAEGAFAAQVDGTELINVSMDAEFEGTVGRLHLTVEDAMAIGPRAYANLILHTGVMIEFFLGYAFWYDEDDINPCDQGADCFEKERCYEWHKDGSVPGLAKYAVPEKYPKSPPCRYLSPLCACDDAWNCPPWSPWC